MAPELSPKPIIQFVVFTIVIILEFYSIVNKKCRSVADKLSPTENIDIKGGKTIKRRLSIEQLFKIIQSIIFQKLNLKMCLWFYFDSIDVIMFGAIFLL